MSNVKYFALFAVLFVVLSKAGYVEASTVLPGNPLLFSQTIDKGVTSSSLGNSFLTTNINSLATAHSNAFVSLIVDKGVSLPAWCDTSHNPPPPVPVPAALWLFISSVGLLSVFKRHYVG